MAFKASRSSSESHPTPPFSTKTFAIQKAEDHLGNPTILNTAQNIQLLYQFSIKLDFINNSLNVSD